MGCPDAGKFMEVTKERLPKGAQKLADQRVFLLFWQVQHNQFFQVSCDGMWVKGILWCPDAPTKEWSAQPTSSLRSYACGQKLWSV